MVIIAVLYLALAFFLITAYVKYIYTPLKNIRNKRRVAQDANAIINIGSSPFVQIDVQQEVGENNREVTEAEEEERIASDETEAQPEIINVRENPALASPPLHAINLKPTIDITALRTSNKSIHNNNHALFKQTSVIIN